MAVFFLFIVMSKLLKFFVVSMNIYLFFRPFFVFRFLLQVELDPVTQTDDMIDHRIVIGVKV